MLNPTHTSLTVVAIIAALAVIMTSTIVTLAARIVQQKTFAKPVVSI